ncbi:hypothetical protein SASPL_137469 [Salvia splendens]|uniref:Translocation protein SEC62 n=1 Tax=Salvia splendens TaxID=180675 RepID=A0A8X8WSY2_SALSN|nr:hypothetical protein SASPL_137469 [Salvia splendens]
MKKTSGGGGGGAAGDKKRGRRSYVDSSTDTPPRLRTLSPVPVMKQAAKKDVFQTFAEKVRDHKELESRWAVLQETRVEYFRGKDFVSFLRNHPEIKDLLESDKNLEIEDIANSLLRKNLIVRCDRVVKTVRPGKRKLSTWPAHLEIFPAPSYQHLIATTVSCTYFIDEYKYQLMVLVLSGKKQFCASVRRSDSSMICNPVLAVLDQVFSDNDAFFAWTFVNRRPLWQTLLSFCWPVLTLAICLFPVYPHQVKLLILYFCAGVLLLILCLLLLRALVFGALWIVLGKRVWFFPNILAEEATLQELFQFWPQKDEGERPKWTARLFFALVAVLVILLLRHHAPDEAARARYQKRVSNIIDDVLEWSPRLALSGMMDKVNETDYENNTTDDGVKATPQPDHIEGETIPEEFEADETPDHHY